MRIIIKLIVALLVAGVTLFYYQVFTFNGGVKIIMSEELQTSKLVDMKNLVYVDLPGDKAYVSFELDKNLIGAIVSDDDLKTYKTESRSGYSELSYIPAGLGVLSMALVLAFPKRKRE